MERTYGDYVVSNMCYKGNHDGCRRPAQADCQCPCHDGYPVSRTSFWRRLTRALAGRW